MLEILSKSVSFREIMKYFLYILACSILFLLLASAFNADSKPITAVAFQWEKEVEVYFSSKKGGSNEDCSLVFPVQRKILNAETLGPGALEALLKGLTQGEKTVGFFTNINSGVLIQKFEVKDRVAYVDLSSEFNKGVGGSCMVTAIRAQVETTLNSLPDIDSVVLSVDGATEGILEP